MKYIGCFYKAFPNKPTWHRDFLVPDSITLETLSVIIQKILNWKWDESSIYIFYINGINYAHFGFKSFIIKDLPEGKYLSCDIPLREFCFKETDQFNYHYDKNIRHKFLITIKSIIETAKETKKVSIWLSSKGQNPNQFPDPISCFRLDGSAPNFTLPQEISFTEPRLNKWKVRFITIKDAKILDTWRKSNDKKKWEKAVVIFDNRGVGPGYLSLQIERPESTVKRWIRTYNRYGLDGLMKPRVDYGNSKWKEITELKTKRILELLHQKPKVFKINRSNWSLASLATVYREQYAEKISKCHVGRLINKAGYTLKKAREVLTSPDPNYREKIELLLKTLRSLKPDEMFFFIDELGPLQVKKYGGRCYLKKGEKLVIPQNQKSKGSITLLGALSATTNQIAWIFGRSKDTNCTIDLIDILFDQYHEKSKLFITWDAASWHNSNQLVDWLDQFNAETIEIGEGPIIDLVPLPSHSQSLNVIESVFSGMKRAVIHHSDYQTEEETKSAISLHFAERNSFFRENPKRVGKKIWEIDFFEDYNNIRSGNYREW